MKTINALFIGFTLSLVVLVGLAFEQPTKANEGLECGLLTGCLSHNSCGGRGTPTGCSIVCEGGGSVTCPTKGAGGFEEPEGN
jgi:hypothetical protein